MLLCLVLDPLLVEPEARFNNFLIREPIPNWCRVISTTECPLARRSETRGLPYIKDMLDLAYVDGLPDGHTWIGFFNADIKLSDRFWCLFPTLSHKEGVFLTKRTDLDHVDQDPKDGEKLLDDSTDGILIRSSIWRELWHTYPDFVLGEPGWGYGTHLWVRRHRLRVHQLRTHECLHVKHHGVWKDNDSLEQERNLQLYAEMKA